MRRTSVLCRTGEAAAWAISAVAWALSFTAKMQLAGVHGFTGAVTWPASPRHRRLAYLWRRLTWLSLRPHSAIGRRGHIRRRRAWCRMGTRWGGGAWPAASSSSALSDVLRLHQVWQQHLLERAASASASRAHARAQET